LAAQHANLCIIVMGVISRLKNSNAISYLCALR
jgi:hypothetical protein